MHVVALGVVAVVVVVTVVVVATVVAMIAAVAIVAAIVHYVVPCLCHLLELRGCGEVLDAQIFKDKDEVEEVQKTSTNQTVPALGRAPPTTRFPRLRPLNYFDTPVLHTSHHHVRLHRAAHPPR